MINRRTFLTHTAAAALGVAAHPRLFASEDEPVTTPLPSNAMADDLAALRRDVDQLRRTAIAGAVVEFTPAVTDDNDAAIGIGTTGSIVGSYTRLGDVILVNTQVTMAGAGPFGGVGVFHFGLPFPPLYPGFAAAYAQIVGRCYAFNSSQSFVSPYLAYTASPDSVIVGGIAGVTLAAPTVGTGIDSLGAAFPWVWAAPASISLMYFYYAAPY